jgi:hypothetical protein
VDLMAFKCRTLKVNALWVITSVKRKIISELKTTHLYVICARSWSFVHRLQCCHIFSVKDEAGGNSVCCSFRWYMNELCLILLERHLYVLFDSQFKNLPICLCNEAWHCLLLCRRRICIYFVDLLSNSQCYFKINLQVQQIICEPVTLLFEDCYIKKYTWDLNQYLSK